MQREADARSTEAIASARHDGNPPLQCNLAILCSWKVRHDAA